MWNMAVMWRLSSNVLMEMDRNHDKMEEYLNTIAPRVSSAALAATKARSH